jgi:hypothetical protein
MQALLTAPSISIRQQNTEGLPILRRLLGANPNFQFHDVGSLQRHEAEDYVARCFAKAYQARITRFMPYLLTMSCVGNISGVAGIRPATSSPLFVEQYLDAPVEDELAVIYNRFIPRDEIFELGNLSAMRPGVCQLIYMIGASVAYRAGFRYGVFACTQQVARALQKLRFSVKSIASADPDRLTGGAVQWGSYYETLPTVTVIDIAESMRALSELPLQSMLFNIYEPQIDRLTRQLVPMLRQSAETVQA